jgi:hypothetical protein
MPRRERSQVLCGALQAACELQVPTRIGRSTDLIAG